MALSGWLLAASLHALGPPPSGPSVLASPTALFLSGGRLSTAATGMWASTVLHVTVAPPGDPSAIRTGVDGALTFDPTLTSAAAYGGRMLVNAGDIDGALAVHERGARLSPDDPWFPWILGMELWQDAGRPQDAVPWLRRAADLDPDGRLHHLSADALERL